VLRADLLAVASEIWSSPAGPVQQAAAYAFAEPPELVKQVALSRRLHATVARAVADRFRAIGASTPDPRAAFYVYPDFEPLREHLGHGHRVRTGADLGELLLERYGVGVLPGSSFGEPEAALRLRVATSLLYGERIEERQAALTATDPLTLPWIAAALARLSDVLTDLTAPVPVPGPGPAHRTIPWPALATPRVATAG
jgi:aspartate aminotransferase